MPVNEKMMISMKKSYGSKKGEEVYYAMENKMKKKKPSAKKMLSHKLGKMFAKSTK